MQGITKEELESIIRDSSEKAAYWESKLNESSRNLNYHQTRAQVCSDLINFLERAEQDEIGKLNTKSSGDLRPPVEVPVAVKKKPVVEEEPNEEEDEPEEEPEKEPAPEPTRLLPPKPIPKPRLEEEPNSRILETNDKEEEEFQRKLLAIRETSHEELGDA